MNLSLQTAICFICTGCDKPVNPLIVPTSIALPVSTRMLKMKIVTTDENINTPLRYD